jgi:hypothetical protein
MRQLWMDRGTMEITPFLEWHSSHFRIGRVHDQYSGLGLTRTLR